MKTTFSIYGSNYEVTFKVRREDKQNSSVKDSLKFAQWLEARIWELSDTLNKDSVLYAELIDAAHNLHVCHI